jgi:hypothetical protein
MSRAFHILLDESFHFRLQMNLATEEAGFNLAAQEPRDTYGTSSTNMFVVSILTPFGL